MQLSKNYLTDVTVMFKYSMMERPVRVELSNDRFNLGQWARICFSWHVSFLYWRRHGFHIVVDHLVISAELTLAMWRLDYSSAWSPSMAIKLISFGNTSHQCFDELQNFIQFGRSVFEKWSKIWRELRTTLRSAASLLLLSNFSIG